VQLVLLVPQRHLVLERNIRDGQQLLGAGAGKVLAVFHLRAVGGNLSDHVLDPPHQTNPVRVAAGEVLRRHGAGAARNVHTARFSTELGAVSKVAIECST